MDFAGDIPRSLALAAHSGTSFVPEKRADSVLSEYAETLRADHAALLAIADTDEKRAALVDEFDRYRAGYRKRTQAYLASRSRLVSTMIAGPSNFPAARMNKRGDVAHKRLNELCEFRHRALEAIRRKLRPELRPIMAGDADAVERLEKDIRHAERSQEAMREANKIIRQKPKYEKTPDKLSDLMTIGLSLKQAEELFEKDFCGRYGFPDYSLSNGSANIRRMKERLEQIQRAKAAPVEEIEGEHAKYEDCPPENRVRLYFPGKPAVEVRDKLKSNGFRWAPSLGCWQAYRNHRSVMAAREVAGINAA